MGNKAILVNFEVPKAALQGQCPADTSQCGCSDDAEIWCCCSLPEQQSLGQRRSSNETVPSSGWLDMQMYDRLNKLRKYCNRFKGQPSAMKAPYYSFDFHDGAWCVHNSKKAQACRQICRSSPTQCSSNITKM